MRKVDQLHDAVHHRVTKRDERDDHAVRQAIDDLLQKNFGVGHATLKERNERLRDNSMRNE